MPAPHKVRLYTVTDTTLYLIISHPRIEYQGIAPDAVSRSKSSAKPRGSLYATGISQPHATVSTTATAMIAGVNVTCLSSSSAEAIGVRNRSSAKSPRWITRPPHFHSCRQ